MRLFYSSVKKIFHLEWEAVLLFFTLSLTLGFYASKLEIDEYNYLIKVDFICDFFEKKIDENEIVIEWFDRGCRFLIDKKIKF